MTMNREEWLYRAAGIFKEELFAPVGVKLPSNTLPQAFNSVTYSLASSTARHTTPGAN